MKWTTYGYGAKFELCKHCIRQTGRKSIFSVVLSLLIGHIVKYYKLHRLCLNVLSYRFLRWHSNVLYLAFCVGFIIIFPSVLVQFMRLSKFSLFQWLRFIPNTQFLFCVRSMFEIVPKYYLMWWCNRLARWLRHTWQLCRRFWECRLIQGGYLYSRRPIQGGY